MTACSPLVAPLDEMPTAGMPCEGTHTTAAS